jgi:hypothetical protein
MLDPILYHLAATKATGELFHQLARLDPELAITGRNATARRPIARRRGSGRGRGFSAGTRARLRIS